MTPSSSMNTHCTYLEGDKVHPVERVLGLIALGAAQSHQQTVGTELDVLAHELAIHPNQLHREGISDELPLDSHCILNDGFDP